MTNYKKRLKNLKERFGSKWVVSDTNNTIYGVFDDYEEACEFNNTVSMDYPRAWTDPLASGEYIHEIINEARSKADKYIQKVSQDIYNVVDYVYNTGQKKKFEFPKSFKEMNKKEKELETTKYKERLKELKKVDTTKIDQTLNNYLVKVDSPEQADLQDINTGVYYQVWGSLSFFDGEKVVDLKKESYRERLKNLKEGIDSKIDEKIKELYELGMDKEKIIEELMKDYSYIGIDILRDKIDRYFEDINSYRERLRRIKESFNPLSNDAIDVLEGIVISNKNAQHDEILRKIKANDILNKEIEINNISDEELIKQIDETKIAYKEFHKEGLKQIVVPQILSDEEVDNYCKINNCTLITVMRNETENKTILMVNNY